MSFREKTAWISLISTLGIYGHYFWRAARTGAWSSFHVSGLLGTIIAMAVVQAALTTGVAILAPKEARAPRDEREKMIELQAARFAYAAMATSVACACAFAAFEPPIVFNTNTLLFILVACETLRSGCQVVQYRRGA